MRRQRRVSEPQFNNGLPDRKIFHEERRAQYAVFIRLPLQGCLHGARLATVGSKFLDPHFSGRLEVATQRATWGSLTNVHHLACTNQSVFPFGVKPAVMEPLLIHKPGKPFVWHFRDGEQKSRVCLERLRLPWSPNEQGFVSPCHKSRR